MASVRGNLLGSEKEVEGLNERIQEMTKEAEANHEISKKLQVGFFPHCTIALTSIYFRWHCSAMLWLTRSLRHVLNNECSHREIGP